MLNKAQWLSLILLFFTMETWAQSPCDGEFVKFRDHAINVLPTGLDDTANLQCALDHAVANNFPSVNLGKAEYFISSVIAEGFVGTLSGSTIASTTVNVLNDSIDCQAMLDLKRTPSAIKFAGGEPRIRNMTIETDTPCEDPGIGLYVLHFTGVADRDNDCTNDVIFGSVDRLVIQGAEVYHPLSSAVAALAEGSFFGGCQTTLLGTFKLNRSEIYGYTNAVTTVLSAAAQVDINFNQFSNNRFDVVIPNANQSATITRNNFSGIATNESDYIGIQVLTDAADAPDSNRVVIHKNTFDIAAPGPGNGSAILFSQTAKIAKLSTIASENTFNLAGNAAFGIVGGGVSGSIVNGNLFRGSASTGVFANPADSPPSSNWAILANLGFRNLDTGDGPDILLGPELSNSIVGAKQTQPDQVLDLGTGNTVLPVGPDVELTVRVAALEAMVAALTSQLESHTASTTAHHERYADSEAVAAAGPHFSGSHADLSDVTADQHHVEYTDTAALAAVGPHFSGSHADLSDVTADQHHVEYTDTAALAAVGPHFSGSHADLSDVTADQHHVEYTDTAALAAVGPHFSGSHADLSDVTADQHHVEYTDTAALAAVGPHFSGSHEDLTNVTPEQHHAFVLEGVTRGIDPNTDKDTLMFTDMNVQIVNGSGTTAGAATGTGNLIIGYNELRTFFDEVNDRNGSHMLVIGERNNYTTNSFGGMVVGLGNETAGQYSTVSGGLGNQATGDHASVTGGQSNIASGEFSAITGGAGNLAIGNSSSISGGASKIAFGNACTVGDSGSDC